MSDRNQQPETEGDQIDESVLAGRITPEDSRGIANADSTPERYIDRLKNPDKRRYATAYLSFLRGEVSEPNPESYSLKAMARQAVRLELRDYFKGQPQPESRAQPPQGANWQKVAIGLKGNLDRVTAQRDEAVEACRAYVRARNDGGISMADLSTIADIKIRAVAEKAREQ